MNTITIPAPLVTLYGCYTKTIAHLLEHICSTNFVKNSEKYFSFIIDSEASTYLKYIKFSFPDSIDIDKAVELLCTPIEKELYIYEREVLYKELSREYQSYDNKLLEKIGKQLYAKKYIKNSLSKPSFTIVNDFHKQYFQKENMIISDRDDNIIYQGKMINTQSINEDKFNFQWIQTDKNNTALCIAYNGRQSHRIAFFIYELLKNFNRYISRYKEGTYYYDDILYTHHKEHIIISYGKGFKKSVDEEFFNDFKKYYLHEFGKSYDNYRKIIDLVYGYTIYDDKTYRDFIHTFSFEGIMKRIRSI